MTARARAPRETLSLDPSYPYQLEDELLALWLPRGRGRGDRARGLVGRLFPCRNPRCLCSEVRLAALAIDDRAGSVSWENDALHVVGRARTELPVKRCETISIDYFTGVVHGPAGAPLSAELSPFFREPLPGWVLDDLYARWLSSREPLASWREQALSEWEPGTLLSHMLVYPEARFDQYVRDGASYQVDFVFCTQPGCACTNGRFCVLEVERESDGIRLAEVGSARLEASDMELTDFHGDEQLVIAVYLDWRSRHPGPADRLRALRDDTRRRGAELHTLAARGPAPEPAVLTVRPGRNDRCRCGSGKKFKHCCGR